MNSDKKRDEKQLRRPRIGFLMCAPACLAGLRAGSFVSPFGLAQDFASWRTPARRLNFGREEWVFEIRFPSVDHPSERNNGARWGPRLKRWAFFYRPARRDWIYGAGRIVGCAS